MSTTSAVYKHLETTDASLQANQLIREVAFATDKDALTYKTEGGVFKYFRNSNNDATTDGILKIESGVYVNAVPGVDYVVSGTYVPYTGATEGLDLGSNNISAANVIPTTDIYTTDWTNYSTTVSATVAGVSAQTTVVWIKKIGKTILMQGYIAGTSTSNDFTFEIPFVLKKQGATCFETKPCFIKDNGNLLDTIGVLAASSFPGAGTSTILGVGKGYSQGGSGGFTTSGAKSVNFDVWFNIA